MFLADIRIFRATNLTIDESLLTGESEAVQKTADIMREDIPVSDRRNMAYAGSTVITGRGCGVVTATGSRTEVGMIARAVYGNGICKTSSSYTDGGVCSENRNYCYCCKCCYERGCPFTGDCTHRSFFPCSSLVVSAIPEGLPLE